MHLRSGKLPVFEVTLPKPPMGNKIICADKAGVYILERGSTIWRCMSNTHMGGGNITVYDGIPNENGFFPDHITDFNDPAYGSANGRMIFQANPAIMGMWMEDGYCQHGLTLVMGGEHQGIGSCVSICWIPYTAPVPRIVPSDTIVKKEPEPAQPEPKQKAATDGKRKK